MEDPTILQRVRQLIAKEALGVPLDKIAESSWLRADLDLSSGQIVAFGYLLEQEFGISLSLGDELTLDRPIATVADVVAVVREHLAAGGGKG